MSFVAYDVSLDALRALRPLLERVAARDAALAEQLRKAAASVPLNLAEGRRRRGRDRTHSFRVAAGSAAESLAALDVADALGYVDAADAVVARAHLDRVLALTWPLVR